LLKDKVATLACRTYGTKEEHKNQEQESLAAEWLTEARRHLKINDYAQAEPLFRKAANAGNTAAVAELGHLYLNIHDFARAREWFRNAAKADESNATVMAELGQLYELGLGGAQDHIRAQECYQKVAEATEGRDDWMNKWAKNALSRLASK
jgi:TPR repeat protein